MGPLGFVNWHSVNTRFRLLMWMVAVVLAIVVLVHVIPSSKAAGHVRAPVAAMGVQAFHSAGARTVSP